VVGSPDDVTPVQAEVYAHAKAAEQREFPLGGIERHAFYARAGNAFATVVTGEERPYGDFILVKGVL
jgi:L-fucose mutarotase